MNQHSLIATTTLITGEKKVDQEIRAGVCFHEVISPVEMSWSMSEEEISMPLLSFPM
jgi:hypothetical protein